MEMKYKVELTEGQLKFVKFVKKVHQFGVCGVLTLAIVMLYSSGSIITVMLYLSMSSLILIVTGKWVFEMSKVMSTIGIEIELVKDELNRTKRVRLMPKEFLGAIQLTRMIGVDPRTLRRISDNVEVN